MGVWCEYCGEQQDSAPEHAYHVQDDCLLRPDEVLRFVRDEILASGRASRSQRMVGALDLVEQCLKRYPWTDSYKKP